MNTIIKSLVLKYLLNILMIAAFGISAATGLIKPGGEHGKRPHDFRSEQIAPAREISTDGLPVSFDRESFEKFSETHENREENTHIYFGLFWLALMLFHTIHNWANDTGINSDSCCSANKMVFYCSRPFL